MTASWITLSLMHNTQTSYKPIQLPTHRNVSNTNIHEGEKTGRRTIAQNQPCIREQTTQADISSSGFVSNRLQARIVRRNPKQNVSVVGGVIRMLCLPSQHQNCTHTAMYPPKCINYNLSIPASFTAPPAVWAPPAPPEGAFRVLADSGRSTAEEGLYDAEVVLATARAAADAGSDRPAANIVC